MEKVRKNACDMNDLQKDNRNKKITEERRLWKYFDEKYLLDNTNMSVFMVIVGKARKLGEEGNKRLSQKENCTKNQVLVIHLNCLAIFAKAKWQKSIKRVKERNWILYMNGSKSKEKQAGGGWVLYGGKL